MKLTYGILFILILTDSSFASEAIKAKDFFNKAGNEDKAVKSVSSSLCHDKRSPARWNLDVFESGPKENVFDSMNECLLSGGGKPAYLKDDQNPTQIQESETAAVLGSIESESQKKFGGLSFSPAIMMVNYSDAVVQDAAVEDGKVVAYEVDLDAVLGVESHFFWTPGPKKKFGIGPYVSLGLIGEDGIDPLSMFGFGGMMGWRTTQNNINSWNVGLGYTWNSDALVLKDGLSDGSETSITDSSKLTKRQQVGGWVLIFSAAF